MRCQFTDYNLYLFQREACLISFPQLVDMFCKSGFSRSTQVAKTKRQRKLCMISGREARMVEPIVRIISTIGYLPSSLVSIGW